MSEKECAELRRSSGRHFTITDKLKKNTNVESNLFQEKLEETMQKIVYLMQNFMIDYRNDGDTVECRRNRADVKINPSACRPDVPSTQRKL